MLKQRIKGLNPLTVSVVGSSGDLESLKGLLAGEVEDYELKQQGGQALAVLPAILNRKTFIVGAKTAAGRISCYLNIPHVKVSSNFNEIVASIVGSFTASYDVETKADYATMKFDA